MGRKIFVSYKHSDDNVAQLPDYSVSDNPYLPQYTSRSYVDYLVDLFAGEEIYKGEGNEDLSKFKDETIKTRLKDKIHDSSITIVLISPNMKEPLKIESDQWIPWEISYSLKEITRNDKMSHANAILALVLPDRNNSYTYYINKCDKSYDCNTRNLNTNWLFQILKDNIFNYKKDDEETYTYTCKHCDCQSTIHSGESSYIKSVKWEDFIKNKDFYLEKAIKIKDNRKAYNITKEVNC